MPYVDTMVDLVQNVNDLCDTKQYEKAADELQIIITSENGRAAEYLDWIKCKKIVIYRNMIKILIDKAWNEKLCEESCNILFEAWKCIGELREINEEVDEGTYVVVLRKQLGDRFRQEGKDWMDKLKGIKMIDEKRRRKNLVKAATLYEKAKKEYEAVVTYDSRAQDSLNSLREDNQELQQSFSLILKV